MQGSNVSRTEDSFTMDCMKSLKNEVLLENSECDKDVIVDELETSGILDETVLIKTSSLIDSLCDSKINESISNDER